MSCPSRASSHHADSAHDLELVAPTLDELVALRSRLDEFERTLAERGAELAVLRSSERRYRAFVEQAAEAVFSVDAQGRFTYVSPSGKRVLGYQPEHLRDANALDLVHPDDVARSAATLAACFADPGVVHGDRVRARHIDGEYRTVEFSGCALSGEGVETDGMVVCLRDVTDHEQALDALRESEQRFRVLSNSSPVGVFHLTTDARVVYCNDRVADIWQRPHPELLGTGWLDHVHPDDVERLRHVWARAIQTGVEYEADLRVVRPDGTMRMTFSRGAPLTDAEGQVTGIIGMISDITERRRDMQALAESEERLREALSAANMLVWNFEVASDRLWIYGGEVSDGWVTVHDAPAGSGTTTLDALMAIVAAEDKPRFAAAIEAAATGEALLDEEYRVHANDGIARWRHTKGRAIRDADGTVRQVVGVTLDVSRRKALEAELTRRTLSDALTGLSNRVHFRQRVEEALAQFAHDAVSASGTAASAPAVLFLDLDDFKTVNDSLGHDAGDSLLLAVAERLIQATRQRDTVARLGGDEFAILIEGARTPDDVTSVADRIIAAVGTSFPIGGRTLRIGGSIGVAFAQRGDRADDLLRNADVAMYFAKGSGKSQWAAFTVEMHAAALERLETESELRQAVERGELRLHFQPIIEIATGAVRCAEALSRWQHPTRGLISLGPYIPVIEATDLIVPVGRWALTEACREAATWVAASGDVAPAVAVNVSGRQLLRSGFVQDVANALRESGLEPHRLALEVTEGVLLADLDAAIARLEALRALGVHLSLDDFGTGYSSLTYLHRLPVDVLKIDRSFVADITGSGRRTALVSAIINVASTLGLTTVAEGVETEAQLEVLRALGCPLVQGFLFAQALPPAAFAAFQRSRPTVTTPAPRPPLAYAASKAASGGPSSRGRAGPARSPVNERAPRDRKAVVLLVDHDLDARARARLDLGDAGYTVIEAGDGVDALRRLSARGAAGGHVDLVLTDAVLPEMSGAALADALAVSAPELPVVYVSARLPMPPRRAPSRGRRSAPGDARSLHAVLHKPLTSQRLLATVGAALRMPGALGP